MGKSAPDAPDYTASAQATANSNRAAMDSQTVANRPNQNTPFGRTSWESQNSFDQGGYDRAMQDWNAQMARADSDEARDQLLALRPGQNDYNRTNWTQNTTLDPEAQRALDAQLGLQSGRSELASSLLPRAQQEFGSAMDWGGFKDLQTAPDQSSFNAGPQGGKYNPEPLQRSIGDSQGYIDKAGDAIYGQWSNRQEPRMQQANEQQMTRLRNQGLKPGDQAYDEAMQRMNQDQDDARLMANYQATIGSGAEGSRLQGMDLNQGNFANQASGMAFGQNLAAGGQQFNEAGQAADRGNQTAAMSFGQGMQGAGFNNQVRQQQIAEQMQRRGFSLNEINAIISGQQVGMPSMPGFNQAGNAGGTNYTGAARDQYSAALDAANAQNMGMANLWGGLTNLGSSFMMPGG